MTSRLACIAVLSGLFAGAAPAAAGDLTLAIQNGRVNMTASNVSARQILAEWARIGQTRILNGDRVVGPPLTLQLNGVPEREALDIILRSVSGYMAVARPLGTAGASLFDRILIMPASSHAPLAQAPPSPPRMPNMQPPMESSPEIVVEDGTDQMDQPQDGLDPNLPAGLQPGNPYGRGGFPAVFPGANRPPQNPSTVNIPAMTIDDEPPADPDNEPVAPNPWGVTGGSTLPGVISQPQPTPNPTSPNPPQGAD